jgi:hypothetical protein
MKGLISIFVMPQELEDLAQTLDRLKRNAAFLDDSVKFKIDITMCLSDELTDWNKSRLPKEYIKERTEELVEKYTDWCSERCLEFEINDKTLGCVSQRRKSWKENPNVDFFIWLDTDMFFKDVTLYYLVDAFKRVKNGGYDMCVVTPEFVKQWDNTWDVIVNKKYHYAPLDYYKTVDIEKESLSNNSEISIIEIPTFKFAGGWFTLISKPLLDKIGVPESFGHYGLEDTFVMVCANIMKQSGKLVSQFVLENIIAGEIHKNRTNRTIKSFISSIDRKDEFKQIAHQNWEKEVKSFIDSIKV